MAGLVPHDWPHSSYSSHFHALTDVMVCFRPRRILETGSGLYSTPFFLSFDIDELVSLENNPEWVKGSPDPRHTLVPVEGRIPDNLPDLDGFDLIFVDDDPVEDRLETLMIALRDAPGIVVVHDTSDERLQRLIDAFPNHTDTAHQPHTTVVCPAATEEFEAWLDLR